MKTTSDSLACLSASPPARSPLPSRRAPMRRTSTRFVAPSWSPPAARRSPTGTIVLRNGLIDAVGADVRGAARRDGHRRRRHDRLSRPHRHGQRRRARRRPAGRAGDVPHARGCRALEAQRDPPARARSGQGRASRRAGARAAGGIGRDDRARDADGRPLQGPERARQRDRAARRASGRRRRRPAARPAGRAHAGRAARLARARPGRRPRRRLPGVAPRLDRVRAPELPRRAASAAREAALREGEDRRRHGRPTTRRSTRIQPALARALPVAFEADLAREILRSLEHGQGVQAGSGHHRRARGRSGHRRPQGAATRA